MAKAKRYINRYFGRSIEMSRANSSLLIYRIPYQNLNSKGGVFTIDNPFIVYILYGKNDKGRDVLYVGKSKNGLKNRPTSHENKFKNWTYCYILTQFKERTFFNDGAIQYIENRLNQIITEVDSYENTTNKTNSGTANRSDEEDCDEYLDEALRMLDILGLDLITHKEAASDQTDEIISDDKGKDTSAIPDGIYYLKRKIKRNNNRPVDARMQVSSGHFIVLKGSTICQADGPGIIDSIVIKRTEAMIDNGTLNEDIILDSPSAAGTFVTGSSCNGWVEWKCEDGTAIDKFRNLTGNE